MIRALQIERDYESYLRGSISIQTTDRNEEVYRVKTVLNQKMLKGPKNGPRITGYGWGVLSRSSSKFKRRESLYFNDDRVKSS